MEATREVMEEAAVVDSVLPVVWVVDRDGSSFT
jgi:hypothetical protein